MSDYLPYLAIDGLAIAFCVTLLFRFLSIWHPFTHYLFYHLYVVTFRAWAIAQGSPTLYERWWSLYGAIRSPITELEVQRALLYSDAAIVTFALGVAYAHRRSGRFLYRLRPSSQAGILDALAYQRTLWLCFPLGLIAFLAVRLTEIQGPFAQYIFLMSMWPIGTLGIAMFYRGMQPILLLPAAAYMLTVGLQGYHRSMLIMPLMYMVLLYYNRRNRKWPHIIGMLFTALIFILFPQGKNIGIAFHDAGWKAALDRAVLAFDFTHEGNATTSSTIFDQMAGSLTMFDDNARPYLGITYTYPVVLPLIPRAFWENKPWLNQHVKDVSTATRPYITEGRVVGIVGESYANFRLPGVIVMPFIFGFLMTLWCLYATHGQFTTLRRYMYLVMVPVFLQGFRDGMTSVLVFGVFMNAPMIVLLVFKKLNNPHTTNTSLRTATAIRA